MTAALHIVILAAGQGTRMKSERPKVLHPIGGKPMLAHVIGCARELGAEMIHVVHGHGAEQVRAWAQNSGIEADDLRWVLQSEQLGTGHAVQQAMPEVPADARVLVLYGDVPLIRPQTLQALIDAAGLCLLSVCLDDPGGYGRVLRDEQNQLSAIVEQKDADPQQRAINEVNTGMLAAPAAALQDWLTRIGNDNASGEYYLTDCISLAVSDRVPASAIVAKDPVEVAGINNRLQLSQQERALQQRIARQLMEAGVHLLDPARIDVRGELRCGRDVQIDVGCVFKGQVELADGVQIGPNCVLENVRLGAGTMVAANSVLEDCVAEADCSIGPFARLRPKTHLLAGAKVGNFVEIKKSTLGEGAKASHLAYVGDAVVGARVNISAGVITCNYDGANKFETQIGDDAFIGTDTQLVAPVKIGKGAFVAAGSTITKDVPDDALAICRARGQKHVENWQKPVKKPSK